VARGQDGLAANTLKYLKNAQPVIGVNPDPGRWDGVLAITPEILAGKRPLKRFGGIWAKSGA
jgi:hypothetical protein